MSSMLLNIFHVKNIRYRIYLINFRFNYIVNSMK